MQNSQIQQYNISSIIGQGGMAKVYLAEHNLLQTQSAIKLLREEFLSNRQIRRRFIAEARSMARMSHPNIIKVTDLIDDNDTVAFVMEYVDGETLKEFIERKGKLSDEEIKSIFSQILDAVGYVHEQNLVHRDIKPSNLMIDVNGKVKLMDFGISKNTDSNSAEYTETLMQMGTPMYMSPEQITDTKNVTAQSDIYSLGVVLWQMVTGSKPYDTTTLSTFQMQKKIVEEALPKTNTIWDNVIDCATRKEPNTRFQNCLELGKLFNQKWSKPKPNIEVDLEYDKTLFEQSQSDATVNIDSKTNATHDYQQLDNSQENKEKRQELDRKSKFREFCNALSQSPVVFIGKNIPRGKLLNFTRKFRGDFFNDSVSYILLYDDTFWGIGDNGILLVKKSEKFYLMISVLFGGRILFCFEDDGVNNVITGCNFSNNNGLDILYKKIEGRQSSFSTGFKNAVGRSLQKLINSFEDEGGIDFSKEL
jgi:serine/threonine protein kinase